jgi:predicted O-methyltransferase YrrM
VEAGTAILLHAIVRQVRPHVMVETGVADGVSTAAVLAAMDTNGHGVLHSIDIADDVGSLVDNRERWKLHVVAPKPAAVAAVINSVGPIDVFLHDGDHRYVQQSREYATAWRALRPGGVLMSDDVDWSYAFIDFAKTHEEATVMMLDRRKVVGLLVRS